jgi:hypothetical protein
VTAASSELNGGMSQLWQRRIMAVTIVALVILLFLVLARCWFLLRTRQQDRRWDDPHSPKPQPPRTDLLIHSDSESEFQRMVSGRGKRPGRHAGSSAGSSSG